MAASYCCVACNGWYGLPMGRKLHSHRHCDHAQGQNSAAVMARERCRRLHIANDRKPR